MGRQVMWQRFTERARQALFYAQSEAQDRGTNEVDSEHVLLGILDCEDSVAGRMLELSGVDLGTLRMAVELRGVRSEPIRCDMILAQGSKRTIELACDEAEALENNYVGTEHLLLGLIADKSGVAGQVLEGCGVNLEQARAIVKSLQSSSD